MIRATLLSLAVICVAGCAIAPSPSGRVISVGHMVIVDHGPNWDRTSVVPMALDDNAHIITTEDGTVEVEKSAGEGRKISLFSGAIGSLLGFLGGLSL